MNGMQDSQKLEQTQSDLSSLFERLEKQAALLSGYLSDIYQSANLLKPFDVQPVCAEAEEDIKSGGAVGKIEDVIKFMQSLNSRARDVSQHLNQVIGR